jgi:hypothetical protein
MNLDSDLLGFETGMADTLEFIPMSVRMKLDLCGLKISLAQWRGLPLAARQVAMEVRCETAVEIQRARRYFSHSVDAFGLGPLTRVRVDTRAWQAQGGVPAIVALAMEALGLPPIGAANWAGLSDFHRFTLVKLTRQGRVRSLQAAIEEFGLRTSRGTPADVKGLLRMSFAATPVKSRCDPSP